MPVTQRQYDIMRLQAQIKISQMVDVWRKQFLRGRMQEILSNAPVKPSEEQPYAK